MQVQNDIYSKIESESEFIGYDNLESMTKIVEIIKDDTFVESAEPEEEAMVILSETPFYAESGGQVADTGWIYADGVSAYVENVQKSPTGQHIHQVRVKEGNLEIGQEVKAMIDRSFRTGITKNHTATHLLHQALKDVLGSHVNQAGSLVLPDRLRFDFTHFASIGDEELNEIEQIVNEKIWAAIPLIIDHKNLDDAKAMGAMALFGEKYSDIVRVVQIGDYSIELCGGCHVINTSQIGLFKITSEVGIGAGTRRIEAVTSSDAFKYLNEKEGYLKQSASLLKTKDENVPERIEELYQSIKQLQKENESLQDKLSHKEASSIIEQAENVEGINVLAQKVNVTDMNHLRTMLDDLKQQLSSGVILLATENDGKVQLAAGISNDLIETGFHAGHLIKQAASICGGGGGGRPDMAQAGGKNPEKIDDALNYAKNYVRENKK